MSNYPKFPERHDTLGMSFADPSEAMKAWLYVDGLWRVEFDQYAGCVLSSEAVACADDYTNRFINGSS